MSDHDPDHDCPACGAAPGALHEPGCDVERCPYCGLQLIACGHERPQDDAMPWTGQWPGVAECEEYGLFAVLVPGQGWRPCAKDASGAQPDLNSLYARGRWDRAGRNPCPRRCALAAGLKVA